VSRRPCRHKVLAVVVVDAIVDEAVGEDAQRLVRPEHRERLLIRDRIRPHAHTLHDLGLTLDSRRLNVQWCALAGIGLCLSPGAGGAVRLNVGRERPAPSAACAA